MFTINYLFVYQWSVLVLKCLAVYFLNQDVSPEISEITKRVTLERPLIRVINNQKSVLQQNWIKLLHHHRQTLEQKKTLTVIVR